MWETGGIRIGRIGGIAVEVHLTFALVILWGAWQGWLRYGSLAGAGYGVLAIFLLFGAVLLHEMGHALQARAFRLRVRRITLLPIGGLAQLETNPSHPWQEVLIALAGPLVNLGISVAVLAVLFLSQPMLLAGWRDVLGLLSPPNPTAALRYFLWVNLILLLFNMIPAFPMDGGRVVRGTLATWLDYETATRLAAWLGRLTTLALLAAGTVVSIQQGFGEGLVFWVAAPIVFFGAWQEEVSVRRRRALLRVEVAALCHAPALMLSPSDRLTPATARHLLKNDRAVPVLASGRLVGMLSYVDLNRVPARQAATVAHAMRTVFPSVKGRDTLWVALQEMNASGLTVLPVIDEGVFLGVVALSDIRGAWRRATRRHR